MNTLAAAGRAHAHTHPSTVDAGIIAPCSRVCTHTQTHVRTRTKRQSNDNAAPHLVLRLARCRFEDNLSRVKCCVPLRAGELGLTGRRCDGPRPRPANPSPGDPGPQHSRPLCEVPPGLTPKLTPLCETESWAIFEVNFVALFKNG
jgi:hypothetical protein